MQNIRKNTVAMRPDGALHLQALKRVEHLRQEVARLQVQSSPVAPEIRMLRVLPLILLPQLCDHFHC